MIVIALCVAGLAALVLGLTGGGMGLSWVGLLWIVVALLARRHALKLKATEVSEIKVATVLQGAALLMVGGLTGLVVGLKQWGIDDPELRWLPIVVGAFLAGFAVLTGGMFALASGIQASVGPPPTVPAKIMIVSATETGTFINERPRIEFVFDVTPDGQATYQVVKKATVPMTSLGSIRVGDGFRALVAGPEDPTNMEIDWTATLPGS